MATSKTYTKITDSNLLNVPIEYKSLNKKDFKGLNVQEKLIDIQENQYLSDVIYNYIDLDEHNTVVINSSVGQGKSFLARKIARDYYMARDEDGRPLFTVIFAVPYKSLIGQYIEELKEDLLEEGIENLTVPDYTKIVNLNDIVNNEDIDIHIHQAAIERMHILTVNCLLANSGENAFEQNFIKRGYLEKIIEVNRDEKRKVIIVFDEIHDAIDNFRQDLIFYLWRFRTNYIIHKAFILSATFNEASKIVIKYISELTSNNLQIIETKRKQITKNISNLHIHLTKEDNYDLDREEFTQLFGKIIEKHDIINVLSYSRKLCTDLIEGINGKHVRDLLFSKYKSKINISIPQNYHLSSPQKKKRGIPEDIIYDEKYIPKKCNIGTTFKTGISIKDENSGYIIILPSARAIQDSAKNGSFGIFTNGIISLIQALARPRKKADIYVIMPYPKQYIEEYHGYFITPDNYMSKLMELDAFKYHLLRNYDKYYFHYGFSTQYELISKKYNTIRKRIEREIKWVEDIDEDRKSMNLPYLKYPTLDMFILEKGELLLNTKYAIWGKDLSAYMVWAAFNNQFVNCKLVEVSTSNLKERIEIDNIQDFLLDFFLKNYGMNPNEIKICDMDIYLNLFMRITSIYDVYIEVGTNKNYTSLSSALLRKHIMSFIQKFTKGNQRLNQKYMKYSSDEQNGTYTFDDIAFDLEDYLLCSITNSTIYKEEKDKLSKNSEENNLIQAYRNLNKIRDLFITKLIQPFGNEIGYICPSFRGYINNPFNSEDIKLIIETFKLINKDYNFKILIGKNGIVLGNIDGALTTIYNLLKNTFFRTIDFREQSGNRERKLIIKEIIPLPEKRTGINLLYKYEFNPVENFENEDDYISIYVDLHEKNEPKWNDVDKMPIGDHDKETNKKIEELIQSKLKKEDTNINNTELSEKVISSKKSIRLENETTEYYDGDVIMNLDDIDKTPISEHDKETSRKLQELLDKQKKQNLENE